MNNNVILIDYENVQNFNIRPLCLQETVISGNHLPKKKVGNAEKDPYQKVVEFLQNPRTQKPKREAALRNQIISTCKGKISKEEADAIIKKLEQNIIISISNQSITYLKG